MDWKPKRRLGEEDHAVTFALGPATHEARKANPCDLIHCGRCEPRGMEQNAGETDLSDRGGREKVGGSWLAESADDGLQRETQNPAVFYKCLANNTSKT